MIPCYQRISRIIFKICFSRSWLRISVTKQTNLGNFTHLQTHFARPKLSGECSAIPLLFQEIFFYYYFQKQLYANVFQDVIRNVAIFTRKHLCCSLFLIKLQAGLKFYFNLDPKESSTQVIPVKIAKFLQTAFLLNTSGGCFCQFDKVTVQWWASADLLFLI